MSRVRGALALASVLLVSGCIENTAPGNDREAALSPPEPPAEVVDAGAATEGVATEMLIPQTMTDADLRNVPAVGDRCLFRFTSVGLPVFVYGSRGVMKLNGKLVALPAAVGGALGDRGADGEARGAGARRYTADPVTVTVRPFDPPAAEGGGPTVAELVLQLADATHELGYHGFVECDQGGG